MATIFVDEAGYTGWRLLDSQQPIFVLSSHDFEESEAKELKTKHFGHVQAETLKFSSLSRKNKSKHHAAVISFLNEMRHKFANRFGTLVVHKPYGLVCKLVDHVIEPSFYKLGIDLYDQGGNLATANGLYLMTKMVTSEEYFRRFLDASQKLFEYPTFDSAMELVELLDEETHLKERLGDDHKAAQTSFLDMLQLALLDVGPGHISTLSKDDLKTTFPITLLVMSKWGERHKGGLDVIHDQSSVMLRQFEDWTKLTSPNAPAALVGMDRRTMQYPIGVKSTKFDKDEDWAGLQIADVVAGALATGLGFLDGLATTPPSDFEKELTSIAKEWPIVDSLWPHAAFTPKELQTDGPKFADPFDYFADVTRAE